MVHMRLGVINTGGTISCCGQPLTPMSASAFAAAARAILDPLIALESPNVELVYVTDLPFAGAASQTLDSTNVQPSDWCVMARYILQHYAEVDGWVVLHGTDSMAFTGAALSFLLAGFSSEGAVVAGLSKPVILTGSQRPLFCPVPGTTGAWGINHHTDAVDNFCGAVAAAQAQIPEVAVYFDRRLMRANRVIKAHTHDANAFASPNCPDLAEYREALVVHGAHCLPAQASAAASLETMEVRAALRAQLASVAGGIDQFPVMPLQAFPAWSMFNPHTGACAGVLAQWIDAAVQAGIKGLVLGSYGQGNFPSGHADQPALGASYQALARAHHAGVVIVNGTQVMAGGVGSAAYASGAWLPEVGAISAGDMTPMAALVKLQVLLSMAAHHQWTLETVRSLVQRNLVGELSV
jgi:L-asparaginase